MSEMQDIHKAQEALLAALGAYAQGLLEKGGEAFKAGRLDDAEAALERARALQAILEEHDALAERLGEVLGQGGDEEPPAETPAGPKHTLGRLSGPDSQGSGRSGRQWLAEHA